MKRSLPLLFGLIFLFMFASLVSAQTTIPNAGFENWTGGNPDGWFSDNVTGVLSVSPVTKSSTAHSGFSSVRGEVVSLSTVVTVPLAPLLQSGSLGSGFSYTQRPGFLTGYYQFSPIAGSGDQLVVTVLLTKGYLATGNAIASGAVKLTAAGSWQQFSIPLLYIAQQAPDTCYIQIALGAATGSTKPAMGSFFLMDDLAFSGTASAVNDAVGVPQAFALEQNFPNPFNPSTIIRFSVSQPGHVSLKVYNILGVEVASLVNEQKEAGTFNVNWNAVGLPSGMYLYRMSVTSEKGQVFEQAKKLVLLK
jgi:hypothetical protein